MLSTISSFYLISLMTSMAGMELFSVALVGTSLWFWWRTENRLTFRQLLTGIPLWRPLVALSAVIVVGILFGDAAWRDKWKDLSRLRFFALYFGLALSFRFFFPAVNRWLKVGVPVALVIAIYGMLQHFIPLDLVRPEGKKAIQYAIESAKLGPLTNGTFNHHLTFANVFLFYALIFISLGLFSRTHRKLILLGIALSLCVLWTGSRIAWVALPLSVLLLIFPLGKKWFGLSIVFLALVLGTLFTINVGFKERVARTFGAAGTENNISERRDLWLLQWELFKSSPVIGVGWNNNERFCQQYFSKHIGGSQERFCGHAHSTVLQILATTGLAGCLCFLWLWWEVFRLGMYSLRKQATGTTGRALAFGILVGWIGFWIQGITQWNFGDAEVLHNVIYFWALSGVLASRTLN